MQKVCKRYDITDCHTTDDILSMCGLDWEPAVVPASHAGSDIPQGGSNPYRAIVRPDTGAVLAYVGDRYRTNSHVRAISAVGPLLTSGALVPHRANVWGGGQKLAAQFQCPDLTAPVGPRSVVSPLLTLYINHDGMTSDMSFFADFDFWCQNMCGRVAKIAAGQARVQHRADVYARFSDVVESRILELGSGELSDRYAAMRRMTGTLLPPAEAVSYMRQALDVPVLAQDTPTDILRGCTIDGGVLSPGGKVLAKVVDAYREDDNGAPGTVWHAYSAVTRYTTHNEGRKGEKGEATRSLRALTGHQDRYARAFAAARQLTA